MKIVKQKLPTNQLRAAISDNSVNEEKRTVDLTWTTGSKGLRRTFFGDYFEELSLNPEHVDLSRLNDGGHPLLAAHDDQNLDSVIGVVERAWLEGDKAGATVRFARDEMSERVFQKVKDKILRNVSVGYSVSEYTDVSAEGDETPTYRATRWTPAELSIVPIGFDKNAKVRKDEQTVNEVEIITRSEQFKENSSMDEIEQKRKEQEKIDALKKEAAEAERSRSLEIRNLVRDAKLDEKLAEDYISRGSSLDEAKAGIELLKKYSKQNEETRIDATVKVDIVGDETDKKREGIVEAILHRVDKVNFKPTQGNSFVGMNLLRMMETFIPRKAGMYDTQLAKRAMSSSDLPYILGNVMEKSAQKKYELQPRTWSRWASTDTLKNYKTHDKVRSGDFASLEERQENGEFKRGSFSEEREQVTLKDWGKILSFTRRMLINDDLSEIVKVSSQSGVAASRLENRLVYEVLTGNPTMGDAVALFHADHDNLGTGGAISDTTIGEAFQLMKEQSSVDGLDKLNLSPQYLICGPQSEVIARKYLAQITPAVATNVNVFSNSLELIVDAEISTNDYFFASNSSVIPTVVLYHLEGEESPRVESRVNFENESVDIKCAHAAIAAPADYRGLVKNANAS